MNSRQDITIGILIPTYNRLSFLEHSLASVLSQTYRNIRIIVIDNGSTDGTRHFMAQLQDPRISYIVNTQNLGLIGSINKGVRLFPSEVTWCTVLPDDDILHEDYLKNMREAVDEYSRPDVINCHRVLIDEAGCALPEKISKPPLHESPLEYLAGRAKFRRKTYLAGIFFSRDAYEAVGGYPHFTTGMATDDAFIFALSMHKGLYYAPLATVSVRIHSSAESASSTGTSKHLESLKEFSVYIKTVSTTSGAFDINTLSRIDMIMSRYIRLLNSYTFLRELDAISLSAEPYRTKKANSDTLFALAKQHEYPLLFPVQAYLACLHIFPSLIFLFRFALAFRNTMKMLRHRVGSGRSL